MKTAMQKLDPLARMAFDELSGSLSVTIRTDGEPSASEAPLLSARGLTVHSRVGDIVTGEIEAKHLLGLAGLPFVRSVQVARRLYAESGN